MLLAPELKKSPSDEMDTNEGNVEVCRPWDDDTGRLLALEFSTDTLVPG